MAESVFGTNAADCQQLTVETEDTTGRRLNETSTPSGLSPVAKDEISDSDGRKSRSQNGSFSSLCGSLDRESAKSREKSFKRRKNSHRQIKRSQTTENIDTAENLEGEELQQFRTQKEIRRDRRLRHTMPIADIKSYNQEPVSKQDTELTCASTLQGNGSSSDDEKKKECYLKPKPPSFQRRERVKLSAERIDSKVAERSTTDNQVGTVGEQLDTVTSQKEEVVSAVAQSVETGLVVDETKSDSESIAVTAARDKPVVGKPMRKKHDSTETVDSTSSYECRFERVSLSEKQQTLRLKLEEKNRQWNQMHKTGEELNTSVESEPVVRTDAEAEEGERKASGSSGKSVEVLTAAKIRTETSETESSSVYSVSAAHSQASCGQKGPSKAMTDDGYSSTVSFKNPNAFNESYSSIDDAGSEVSSSRSSTHKIREIVAVEEETKSVLERINSELNEAGLGVVPEVDAEFGLVTEEIKAESSEKSSDSECESNKETEESVNTEEMSRAELVIETAQVEGMPDELELDVVQNATSVETSSVTRGETVVKTELVTEIDMEENSAISGFDGPVSVTPSLSVQSVIEAVLEKVEAESTETVAQTVEIEASEETVGSIIDEPVSIRPSLSVESDIESVLETVEAESTETVAQPVEIEASEETVGSFVDEPVSMKPSLSVESEIETVLETVKAKSTETVALPLEIEFTEETVRSIIEEAVSVTPSLSVQSVIEAVLEKVEAESIETVAQPVEIEASEETVGSIIDEPVSMKPSLSVESEIETVLETVEAESTETVAQPVEIEASEETVGSIIDEITAETPKSTIESEAEGVYGEVETAELIETGSQPLEIDACIEETVDSIVATPEPLTPRLSVELAKCEASESAHTELTESSLQPIEIDSGLIHEETVGSLSDVAESLKTTASIQQEFDVVTECVETELTESASQPLEIEPVVEETLDDKSIAETPKALTPQMSFEEEIKVCETAESDVVEASLQSMDVEAEVCEETSVIESIQMETPVALVEPEAKEQSAHAELIDAAVEEISKEIEVRNVCVEKLDRPAVIGMKPETARIVDELISKIQPEPVKRMEEVREVTKKKTTSSVIDELINMIQPEKVVEVRTSSVVDELINQIMPEKAKKVSFETSSIVDDLISQIQPEHVEKSESYKAINVKGKLFVCVFENF